MEHSVSFSKLVFIFVVSGRTHRDITKTPQRYSNICSSEIPKERFELFVLDMKRHKVKRVVRERLDVGGSVCVHRERPPAMKRSLRKMLTGSVQLILIEIS